MIDGELGEEEMQKPALSLREAAKDVSLWAQLPQLLLEHQLPPYKPHQI